ncbi:MAG: phasin family protein [Gammaproteobacteria bacterium]|nr:phasin family protein [Gammaproteobacteria bacterium]
MYQDFLKLTQDSLKPVMQLAENNTALAVNLMKSQSEKTVELLESNLAHLNALVEVKDVNKAIQLQQKYVETLGEKLVTASKENAAAVETAMSEAGKLFEGSLAEVQAQAKKTVEKLEKEMSKVTKKNAA